MGLLLFNFFFRALLGKDKLDITADMIAGYLHGDRPKEVATLLQKDTFTSATIVNIRDCLALQLILQNFKRSGDIRGLYVNDVLNATVAEGGDFAEIPVSILKQTLCKYLTLAQLHCFDLLTEHTLNVDRLHNHDRLHN